MKISLKVSKHAGTETFTLTEQHDDERMPTDCKGDGLSRNRDGISFYRAVARYLYSLYLEGHDVVYKDVAY
jgi:hypothetical protein